jgi:FkbM family methyltransferase
VSVLQRLARLLAGGRRVAPAAGGAPAPGPVREVALGHACRFALPAAGPGVRRRVFLKHGRILYPQPIAEAPLSDAIELYPEAPGRYVLAVQSTGPDGSIGWAETPFEVRGATGDAGPRLVTVDDRTRVWVPTAWEAQVIAGHERLALERLRGLVAPGAVVYDIGAHLGLYAIALARWAGPAGHVYCLEADPLCVYFLNANLDVNGVENADVLPLAIVDRAGSTELTINYHNLLVGVVKESAFSRKPGHRITVPATGLDELIASHGLRPPTLVKLDIEGAEVLAVEGMRRTIAEHRPVLFVELHGRDAARQTLRSLAGAGYTYTETSSGKEFGDEESLIAWFPDACLQVIGQPGPR